MLQVDPVMLPRLDELEDDLHSRRRRAVAEGWHGETEGLDLTLRFLADKRQQAQRLHRTANAAAVHLGMPGLTRSPTTA